MTISVLAKTSPSLEFPSTPLEPPSDVVDVITKALLEAQADVREFAGLHSVREHWKINQFALRKMKWPPGGDAQDAELKLMHRIADSRTPDGVKTAQWYSTHGMDEAWVAYLADYTKTVGPRQARRATKLLNDTLDMVNQVTQQAKAAAGRKRPYDTDPTLQVAIDKPGGSPSYPSGHTSAAFAAAIVLGYLMPQRAKEFMDIATQASFARIYGGVHYPSDVAAGARIAATVALYLCGISDVRAATHERAGRGTARRAHKQHAA